MKSTNVALHDELQRTTQRWPVAAGAKVERFVREKVSEVVAVQSRRVIATAQLELANRALIRFMELLYEADLDGRLFNVADNGRILIPTPWSRWQHQSYGLTDHNSR